ncbi:uncharacterized protein KQ657_001654 [Scheffersomyces spartinae]|uniref:Major facilitator superfamily (MFS) profile domain-containing protein n=1 Tax=Scheffersomyces spartinae TaxID=45513 RepID=A0A9P7V7B6_9ASCO|nr:uncharacterized protein KQ657_001654 [Scheffersomyces spartinae]KAG7192555.1 hypothetical protein KQ657_001654 [Scheffersomyces spartinae]
MSTPIYNEKIVLTKESIGKYFKTRWSTLFDIPLKHSDKTAWEILNPIPGLRQMTSTDWNFYLLGFFGWTVDALDFFCVSVSAPEIAKSLGVSITDITWGVTLVLMLRSVGALIFGLSADYFGRKWCFILICFLFVVVELGTGFVQTYQQFLGVRALFGVLMGAFYPIASVTALEDQPMKARSILSGFFLPGYNLGYLLATVFYRGFQFTYKEGEGWRSLFWFSAGLPVILIAWRMCFPESPSFQKLKARRAKLRDERMAKHTESTGSKPSLWTRIKSNDLLETIRTDWLLLIFLVLLMSGFNFMSHGSQDLYPTLLVKQHNASPNQKTIIMVVVNIGAICGGIFFGNLTELLGRRLTIMICCLFSSAFLYPSFFSNTLSGIIGGYFFLNFGVMGAWGVAPLHLMELVNTAHRAFLSGIVYQLGNLASSASITIEARIAERFPLKNKPAGTYDYGKVMCIFCAAVFAYMLVAVFLGPEKFHKELSLKHDYTDDEDMDGQAYIEASKSFDDEKKLDVSYIENPAR